jgi:putative flippase GtrA
MAIFGIIFFFDANPLIANAIGYSIGLIVSFSLNRFWTFKDTQDVVKVFPSYFLVAAIAYLVNLCAVLLGTYHLGIGPYSVQFFGVSTYTVTMFLGCRYFVFKAW